MHDADNCNAALGLDLHRFILPSSESHLSPLVSVSLYEVIVGVMVALSTLSLCYYTGHSHKSRYFCYYTVHPYKYWIKWKKKRMCRRPLLHNDKVHSWIYSGHSLISFFQLCLNWKCTRGKTVCRLMVTLDCWVMVVSKKKKSFGKALQCPRSETLPHVSPLSKHRYLRPVVHLKTLTLI